MAETTLPVDDNSKLLSALKVDMSGPLTYQNLAQKQTDLQKQIVGLELSNADLVSKRDIEAAKTRKKATDEASAKYDEQIKKEQEKLDSFGDVKFQPTQDNLKDIAGLFSAVGIIGAIMGGGGRNSSMNALSSMTGMLNGWKQGRADLFKQEKLAFDAHLNTIKAQKDAIIQKMNMIEKEYVRNKEKGEQDLQVFLAEQNSPILKNIAMSKGLTGVSSIIKDTLGPATDSAVKLKNDMTMEGVRQANRMKVAAAERQTALINKIDREVLNEARAYPKLNLESLTNISKEGTKRIVGGLDQLRETEHTVDFIKKNPNAVGALAKLRNVINLDALKSINTGDEFNDAVSRSATIDKSIDDATKKGRISRDEAQAAKILQKQLFTLALADVQASGQRGTVYLDKQFQGLYDQASNIDTLLKILHEREISADRRLQVFDMGVANRSDRNQFGFYLTGPDQWLNQNYPVLAPEQVEAKIKDKSLKSGDWFRDKNGQMRQVK